MLSVEIIVVIVCVLFVIISSYKELFKPVITFLIPIAILGVFRILSAKDISGFANEQIATIILLIILSNVIQKTQYIEQIFDFLFRNARTYKGFLIRMMSYVSLSSGFFNNTPLVAILIPYINSWGKAKGISPSRLLTAIIHGNVIKYSLKH